MDSSYRHRLMLLAKTHGLAWTHGIDMDSWYRHELMEQTWIHGRDMDMDMAECCLFQEFFHKILQNITF